MTRVAIVGSGPAGCFVADQLTRKLPGSGIDVFERLPTPFGLIRGGVAPDHQGTKAIVRQFERLFAKPGVRFFGNVEIGRDLSYLELKSAYQAVVVAIGAFADRPLGIPGEALPGVFGSAAFVGWYNGVPDHASLDPPLDGHAAAVIGNGNVALDIVRLLVKTADELASSDLGSRVAARLAAARLTDIYLIGRRGPAEAGFTPSELAELGTLARLAIRVDGPALTAGAPVGIPDGQRRIAEKNIALLREFHSRAPGTDKAVTLHLLFHEAPAAVLGEERAVALRLERTECIEARVVGTGAFREIGADLVVSAIGYATKPFAGLPFDESAGRVASAEGRVEAGVYATGWCRRGPRGAIPANRADALAVAELVAADIPNVRAGAAGADIDALLRARGVRVVDFAGWQRIDAAERAAAVGGRPRDKLVNLEDLLAAARA